jgi:hypothetical protein
MDLTSCPETNQRIWRQARGERIAGLDEDQLNHLIEHHPRANAGLDRLMSDIEAAPLPPIVDKGDLVERERAEYDRQHVGDRFE